MPVDKLPDFAEAERDLLQRVNSYLHQQGFMPPRTLEISVERGVVVVRGRMPTFYLRQIAIECIKRVAGVTQVVDLITVVHGPVHPQAMDSAVDEQEFPTAATRHHAEAAEVAGTAKDASRR